MSVDLEAFVGEKSAPTTLSWTDQDTMLYALSVGAGRDPNRCELKLTVEDSSVGALCALPSMAAALCLRVPSLVRGLPLGDHPVVHASQSLELHQPLPAVGSAELESSISAVHDTGRGAVVVTTTTAKDPAGGQPLFASTSQAYVMGAGGFGGSRPARHPGAPERSPDREVDLPTWPEQALLYRLTGDRNKLHADPAVARKMGFPSPILHGLATLGVATRALTHEVAGGDPEAIRSLHVRFSDTVIPGALLRLRIWESDTGVDFEVWGPTGSVVLKEGALRLVGHSV